MSQPQPPPTASATYKALHATTLSFLSALGLNPSLPLRLDFERLESLCTPTFTHSFGHTHAVAQSPYLQGAFTFDGFSAHLRRMLPRLDSFDIRVSEIVVDEPQSRVVARLSFLMHASGCDEVVVNDLVWILGMKKEENKDGEWRVDESCEFVDPTASARLMELMGAKGEKREE